MQHHGFCSFEFRRERDGARSDCLERLVRDQPLQWSAAGLVAAALGKPGTALELRSASTLTVHQGIRRLRVDRAPYPLELPPLPRSERMASGWLRAVLSAAIERQLANVSRVGVLCGGGLDSSALVALVHRWAQQPGKSAFVVALDYEASGDDRPHLRALEAHVGCEVIRVQPEQAAAQVRWVHAGIEASPFVCPTGPLELELLEVARRHGAQVCLAGAGGDEAFDGDPRALAQRVRRGGVHQLGGAMRDCVHLAGFGEPAHRYQRWWSWLVRPMLAPFQPQAVRRWRSKRRAHRAPPWATQATRDAMRDHPHEAHDVIAAHRDGVAWLAYQLGRAAGCELRYPFFDVDFTQAMSLLPPWWLLQGSLRRGLLREAVRGLVPESLRMRLDKARVEPAVERWFRAANVAQCMRSAIDLPQLKALGLVDSRRHKGHGPEIFQPSTATLSMEPTWLEMWPVLAVEGFVQTREGSRLGSDG